MHLAPALLVHRSVAELQAAAPLPAEDPTLRWAAIARAGELLTGASLGGCSAEEHAQLVTRATGTPLTCSRLALAELAAGLGQVQAALGWQAPGGDLSVFRTRRVVSAGGRRHAWVPVGRVLGFVAPSNHPAVHLSWVLALAMGWTVAVRPGADDPLTPWRLILALQQAGFPTNRVALLPGSHDLVPALVQACDRTVVYGGPALAAVVGRDARVLFNGPGHSKVLVDAPAATAAAPATPGSLADFLLECVAHDGGRKCTCASAVVVRGRFPGLLDALAERLAALPLLDPLDPAARVPALKGQAACPPSACTVTRHGLTFIQPELVRCPDAPAPPFGQELPAPWVTAAELPAGADPLPLLRGSLAITLLSADPDVQELCLLEPSIHKVFTGLVPPWHTLPGAPHQGRLSEFLFTSKACQEVARLWI